MTKTIKLLTISLFMFFQGCGLFIAPVKDIAEIAFRGQTGLLGSAYTVSFRKDGTATCECSFYNLDKNKKPNLEYVENICTDLYRKEPSAFFEVKGSSGDVKLNGNFTGKITEDKFESLAQILRDSGFFSISVKRSHEVMLDAPPNFVKVVYDGKTKEVSDADEDLLSIKSTIIKTAIETSWLSKER